MYVSLKDLDTIAELSAFVDGALESADDVEYWGGLSKRVDQLQRKMTRQREADFDRRLVKKYKVLRCLKNR